MLIVLGLSLGMAVASALVPLITLEVWVLAVVVKQPDLPWWQLATVVAIGQVLGKLLYFYGGRGQIPLPNFLKRKSEKKEKGRWGRFLDRFRDTCRHRPAWTFSVMLASSLFSLPPYAATAVVAGVGRVPLSHFITSALVGRFTRFALLAATPAYFSAWVL